MNYIYLKNNQYQYATIRGNLGTFCVMDNQLYPLQFDNEQGQFMIYVDHIGANTPTPYNIPKTLSLKSYRKTFQSENITPQSVYYQIAQRIINPEFVIDIDVGPSSCDSLQIQIWNNDAQLYTRTVYYDPVICNHIHHFAIIPYSFYYTNIKILPEFTGKYTISVTADRLIN